MKRPETIIKELRVELAFAQMHVRQDAASYRRSVARVKEIAAQMRKVQHEAKAKG